MKRTIEIFSSKKLIPVIKIEDIEKIKPLAEALLEADLPIMEITFRAKNAEKAIKTINDNYKNILLGAGTVRSIEQVKMAVDNGASFIVSPGLNPKIAEYCVKNNINFFPGVNSPSQIETALEYGLNILKFFPAEANGGIKFLKALKGPYSDVSFIPTGGINLKNITDYIKCSNVTACGGSWICSSELIKTSSFKKIKKLSKQAMQKLSRINL